jgi:hypothetical protein
VHPVVAAPDHDAAGAAAGEWVERVDRGWMVVLAWREIGLKDDDERGKSVGDCEEIETSTGSEKYRTRWCRR